MTVPRGVYILEKVCEGLCTDRCSTSQSAE